MKIDDDVPEDVRLAARRLKGDAAFEASMKYLEMVSWMMFSGTAPEEQSKRDLAYHQYSALQQIRELIDRWSRDTE